MARKLLVSAVGAGLALVGASLAPGIAVADSPFDHVVGGGQNNPPGGVNGGHIAHFEINVKSGPNGENPQGSFSFKTTEDGPPHASYSADVTCMRVVGNMAFVVGRVTKSENKPDTTVGSLQFALLKDVSNGPNSDDEIQNGKYAGSATNCPSPTEPRPEAITHGNIEIYDAS